MKTTDELRADITRRLSRSWAGDVASAATGSATSDWPHAFPVGQPTTAELTTGFADLVRQAAAIRAWAAQQHLRVTSRTRRVHGTDQELPKHVVVSDIDTAAQVAAGEWPGRLARGRDRHAVLTAAFPYLPDTARTLSIVDPLSDVDFALACRAGRWFSTHDATGLTPRQVPIEGLHAKWLNMRHALVRDLAGVDDLKLTPPHPARLHFTYLDPEHRRAGKRLHDCATVGDVPDLLYRPRVVVISENKDTALHFHELPGAISVEGVGRGGSTAAAFEWLVSAPLVVYWGDMDADGLEILDGFRGAGVPATSILMNPTSYEAWERFGTDLDVKGRPLTGRTPRPVPHLTDDERALYLRLTQPNWTRFRRVEQERIPLDVALSAVEALS